MSTRLTRHPGNCRKCRHSGRDLALRPMDFSDSDASKLPRRAPFRCPSIESASRAKGLSFHGRLAIVPATSSFGRFISMGQMYPSSRKLSSFDFPRLLPRHRTVWFSLALAVTVATVSHAPLAGANPPTKQQWLSGGQNISDTHSNPFESQIKTQNVGSLGVKWTFGTAGDVSATPAIVNG